MPRGSRRLPDACVRELERADLILHAGDVIAPHVLDELAAFAPVAAVHGNKDEPALVETLPRERVVEVEGTQVGLVHNGGPRAGRDQRLVARFPGCAAVVYGHTHIPQVTLHAGVWVLNPGSPTERRRSPSHTMAVVRNRRPTLLEL
jgi:putative phosphoesterase